jgi:hypothetical protein
VTWIVTSWPLLLINCAAIALSPPVLEPWGQYRSLSHFCKAPPNPGVQDDGSGATMTGFANLPKTHGKVQQKSVGANFADIETTSFPGRGRSLIAVQQMAYPGSEG